MYHDAKSCCCCCCCCPFCYVAAFVVVVVVVVVRFALLFTQVVASSCFVFQSSIYCSCARFMEFAAGCNLKYVRVVCKNKWDGLFLRECSTSCNNIRNYTKKGQTFNRSTGITRYIIYLHMYTIPAKLSPYLFILSPVFLQYFVQLFMCYW